MEREPYLEWKERIEERTRLSLEEKEKRDKEFCKKLSEMLGDETKGIKEYKELMKLSIRPWVDEEIEKIQFQEENHAGTITSLIKSICK